MNYPSVSMVGAGNVGSQLALALLAAGVTVVQLYSRTTTTLAALPPPLQMLPHTTDLGSLLPADIYILAVKDDQIAHVATQLLHRPPHSAIVHTSGTVPSVVLAGGGGLYGIFYPLQSMRSGQAVAWQQIPLCVWGSSSGLHNSLLDLAHALSSMVYVLDDEQRAILHLAAVMVNNFTNHLFDLAYQLLQRHQLSFDILLPLIAQTAQKVQQQPPAAVQTGPAARNDQQTIARHLQLLQSEPAIYQQLYHLLTASIQHQSNPHLLP